MDKKYEISSTWWHAPEQEELRRYCATGWGWKIWQAVYELQNGQQNIPEIIPGWKLVPVEPTVEMVLAAQDSEDVVFDKEDDSLFIVNHKEIYRSMLAVAPEVNSGKTD
ncbi:hypothetical protein GC087_21560 [Pantoea sp. JZ2]|uniref:hypothetical protein n=1 Tax=Pantoea sp. JZ2 TaxID=2654189 RepID=UPI002B4A01E1|nr:hypothetical protein [Pantoea sp. JZ2]WRH14997.1 hypothetical protein GC087_21560 [Pantoea sp. JZ2]